MAQYFNLTLDTTAPSSGVLSGLQSYYNGTATVTISASNASYMKVWTNTTAVGTTSDSQIPGSWEPYNTSKTVSFSSQGTNYIHALFMDEVGNISSVVDSTGVTYDTVAPTVSAVSINNGDGYTKNASNTVRVTFSDATSGVTSITLSGDIAQAEATSYNVSAAERSAGYKDITVTFSTPDGTKTVTATATDAAGNISTSVSDTIVYDTTAASITPVLRKNDDSANLPAYVNYTSYGVRINTESTDIVSYKVWEGSTEPSSWTDISNATEVSNVGYFIDNLTLSSGDGLKTIHVKVQDIAGNVTEGTALTVTLDTTAPVVTLTSDVSVISAEAPCNRVTFSGGATDTNSAEGLNYELKLGTSVIKSGTFTDTARVRVTQAEIEEISSGEGTKSFTLEVTDIAGNTGVSTAVVITLDKTAPTGSIVANAYYNTSSVDVTVSATDTGGAGMYAMRVWLDNPDYTGSDYPAYEAGTYTFTNVAEGQHTAYVRYIDSVYNVSSVYSSSSFIVDTTAPTGTISGPTYTNTRSVTIAVSASDEKTGIATSGVAQMKVWEAGTTEPSSWETYAETKSLTLTSGDGSKTINAKFKDAAGNATDTVAATCTIILDTDEPDVTLVLTKTDDTTVLPAHVNTVGFNARIGFTNETQDSPIVSYKLTGDFVESSDTWQTFTADSGQSYMTISDLSLTSGDGLKTITALLLDEAGNVSATGASVTVTYDSSAPVIDVNTPDYSIVSKQHTSRLNSSGVVIANKYNDMCTFTWSSNEALQAFKVCVNEAGQTAAGATAIGTTNGSQNMSGGSVEANTDVTSVIFGLDFAATDIVNDTDGAYEVIVYGQDEAGTWSAVHVLTAEPTD